jgi:hypothetical protein
MVMNVVFSRQPIYMPAFSAFTLTVEKVCISKYIHTQYRGNGDVQHAGRSRQLSCFFIINIYKITKLMYLN